MKLVELKCKNCGANLKVPENQTNITCEFCNTTFHLDDEVQHIQYDNMQQSGYEFEKGKIKAKEEYQKNYFNKMTTSSKNKKNSFNTFCISIAFVFLISAFGDILFAKDMNFLQQLF